MADENASESIEGDETPDAEVTTPENVGETVGTKSDTFPREYVENLRDENAKHRQNATQLSQRLHQALVEQSGRLADPTDLPYDAEHLDNPEALTAAIDSLLESKPHLASRKPVGDIGQGDRGKSAQPANLLSLIKARM